MDKRLQSNIRLRARSVVIAVGFATCVLIGTGPFASSQGKIIGAKVITPIDRQWWESMRDAQSEYSMSTGDRGIAKFKIAIAAVSTEEEKADALVNLACSQQSAQKQDEAIDTYKKFLAECPHSPYSDFALYHLGMLYISKVYALADPSHPSDRYDEAKERKIDELLKIATSCFEQGAASSKNLDEYILSSKSQLVMLYDQQHEREKAAELNDELANLDLDKLEPSFRGKYDDRYNPISYGQGLDIVRNKALLVRQQAEYLRAHLAVDSKDLAGSTTRLTALIQKFPGTDTEKEAQKQLDMIESSRVDATINYDDLKGSIAKLEDLAKQFPGTVTERQARLQVKNLQPQLDAERNAAKNK